MHGSRRSDRGRQAQKLASVGCSEKGRVNLTDVPVVEEARMTGAPTAGLGQLCRQADFCFEGWFTKPILPSQSLVCDQPLLVSDGQGVFSVNQGLSSEEDTTSCLTTEHSVSSHSRNGFRHSQDLPFPQSNMARKLKGEDFSGSLLLIFGFCKTFCLLSRTCA